MRAWHHHGSVTPTSARAVLHHTDHTLGKHFAPECILQSGLYFMISFSLTTETPFDFFIGPKGQ